MNKNTNLEETKKLIDMYQKSECLWNIHHPQFNNSSVSAAAYSEMAKALNCSTSTVKRKLQRLKDQFKAERSRLKVANRQNVPFNSRLPWFEQFQAIYNQKQYSMKVKPGNGRVTEKHLHGDKKTPPVFTPELDFGETPEVQIFRKIPACTPTPPPSNSLDNNNAESACDIFAKSVGYQLKQFSFSGCIEVQTKIQALLTEELIKDRKKNVPSLPF